MTSLHSHSVRQRNGSTSAADCSPLVQNARVASPAHLLARANAGTSFTVDLWEGVMADATHEEWERLCADSNSSDSNGNSAAGGAASTREAASTPSLARGAAAPGQVLTAEVFHYKRRCTMTFDKATDKLLITRVATKPGRKAKIILYVPMHAVLNIETHEERDLRQRTHVANDDAMQLNVNKGNHPADRFLCNFAESEGDSHVYTHSRVNTYGSSVATCCLHTRTQTNMSTSSYPNRAFPSTGATYPPPDKYFLHYTKAEKSGGKKSIHSLELSIVDNTEKLEAAFTLAKALLRRIYLDGPKHMITFISPKSGTGHGEEIFNNNVKPFLHFSRHSLHVMVTRCAHDAENYLADLDHHLDGNCVAVAVGGDGMMHEVVNGLHRRKQQLIELIREECRQRIEEEEGEGRGGRASATDDGISRGGGGEEEEEQQQAGEQRSSGPIRRESDSLVECVNGKEDEEEIDDESSAALTQEVKKSRREDADKLHEGGGYNNGARGAGNAMATANGEEQGGKRVLTVKNMRIPSQHQRKTPSAVLSSSVRSGGGGVSATLSPRMGANTSPSSAPLHTPPYRPLSMSSMPLVRGSGPRGEVSFAAYITDTFLHHGWDGLMPMAATVPAGSACGLAKSLDVLSVTQAAIALVHLSSCPEDLLNMNFEPNEELVAFHRDRWSSKKRKSAEEKFREYQERVRHELSERGTPTQGAMPHSPTALSPNGNRAASSTTQAHRNMSLFQHASTTRRSSAASSPPPFLKDGSAVYSDPVSLTIGAPEMSNRVAFMSLSFGIANDVDRGSEPLRWMGNARFVVYGGYVLLKGISPYTATIRYLPWTAKDGFRLEKLHPTDKMPDPSQFPRCTMTADCPHCLDYPPPEPLQQQSRKIRQQQQLGQRTQEEEEEVDEAQVRDKRRRRQIKQSLREFHIRERDVLDVATVANASDADMLGESAVDFNDDTLPWVTVRGEIYSLLLCSLRDVAQDMMMAPLCHMNDGAIDLVFARRDAETGKGGRKEFFQFFSALASGDHVNQWFTNYVKASAVEVKVDGGISMSDGEMMPLSTVRLTKLRSTIRMVRSDE